MTIAKQEREENHRTAFKLMIQELGDGAINTTCFSRDVAPFAGQILRTTWEELLRLEYVTEIGSGRYRFTPDGWLVGLHCSGESQSKKFEERLGRVFSAMKRHVKGRKDSAMVDVRKLAVESGEPEGMIFNMIDSRASSSIGLGRTGATWFNNERGRLIEIPVDFNLEPVDIASALTVQHLEKIRELEARIEEIEEDRAQFHCPYCGARISGIVGEDFPDHHCYVTYEHFECGYVTADGFEASPCPYGPKWPQLEEFDFLTKQDGNRWLCYPAPKTARARKVDVSPQIGMTREEAEERAKRAAAPKKR